MAFAVTPAENLATAMPAGVDVACIDFITDPAVCTVKRGVGEHSHIITIITTPLGPGMNFNRAANSMYVSLIEDI